MTAVGVAAASVTFAFGMCFLLAAIGAAGMWHEDPQDGLPLSYSWRSILAFCAAIALLTISVALVGVGA